MANVETQVRDSAQDILTLEVHGERGLDDISQRYWPISLKQALQDATISISGTKASIQTEVEGEKKGFQIRSRNSTGGDYCNLHQYIRITGNLELIEDDGELSVADPIRGDVHAEVHFDGRKFKSHGGERPPF